MKKSELRQLVREELNSINESYKKSKSGWYLITKNEVYDRDYIPTELFITKTPDKFNNPPYKIQPIEIK